MYVAPQVLNIPSRMSFITIEKCDSIKIKVSSCIFRADKTDKTCKLTNKSSFPMRKLIIYDYLRVPLSLNFLISLCILFSLSIFLINRIIEKIQTSKHIFFLLNSEEIATSNNIRTSRLSTLITDVEFQNFP